MLAGGGSQENVTSCLWSGGVNSFPFIYSRRTNNFTNGQKLVSDVLWRPRFKPSVNWVVLFAWSTMQRSALTLMITGGLFYTDYALEWPAHLQSPCSDASLQEVLNWFDLTVIACIVYLLPRMSTWDKHIVHNFTKDDNLIWSGVLVDKMHALTYPLDVTFVKRLDFSTCEFN